MSRALHLVEMGGKRDQAVREKGLSIFNLLYFPLFSALGMIALQNEHYREIYYFLSFLKTSLAVVALGSPR